MSLKVKGPGAQIGIGGPGGYVKAGGNPIPYILPWVTAAALALLAVFLRFTVARDQYVWFWSPFVLVVYVGLTYGAWRTSRARGPVHNALATGGVGLAGLWSFWVAGVPELTWRPWVVYLLLTVAVCGVSCMFSAFKEGQPGGPGMHDRLAGAIGKLKALNEIREVDGQIVARYEMEPGTPAAALQDHAGDLAATYPGVPPNGVKVLPSTDLATVGELRISVRDEFKTPRPDPGPSIQAGGSIADPIILGNRRGTAPLQLWLPGDPKTRRNASHVQVTGMPGSGKTVLLRRLMLEVLSRVDAEYDYLNPRKFHQEPKWVVNGSRVAFGAKKDIIRYLKEVRAEMPARSKLLGDAGYDQWRRGCPVKFRVTIIDEIAGVAGDVEDILVDLAETLRSLGWVLVVGLQRASHDRWPTSARSAFGTSICLGVKDDKDAEMALPEEALDAGAAPWLWQTDKPGAVYLCAPGVAKELWSDEARTFDENPALTARWAEHYIAAAAGGQSPAPVGAAAVVPLAGDVDDDDGDEEERVDERDAYDDEDQADDELDNDDDEDENMADVEEEVERLLADDELADEDTEIEPPLIPHTEAEVLGPVEMPDPETAGGGMSLRLSPQMPPEEARMYARRYLAALFNRGTGRPVTFKVEYHSGDILAAVGYRSSWLTKVLGEFCAEEPAWIDQTDERGWYKITRSPIRELTAAGNA